MAITSGKNQYRGVNPHLQSLLQTPGTPEAPSLYPGFHSQHVINIAEFLNANLPRQYIARAEQSLQIYSLSDWDIPAREGPQRPDVTLYRRAETPGQLTAPAAVAAPTWQATVAETVDLAPEDQLMAVVIYRIEAHRRLGTPVAQLELLSPANKPGGRHSASYRQKRAKMLEGGLPLVEIDYLHEQMSPLIGLPVYPHDSDAYPFTVAVSDPRPSLAEGRARVYGFNVDVSVPVINVPLDDDNSIPFNFDEVYQYTFERGRWGEEVDYEQLPARFESYSRADQARIRARMAAIKAAHEAGADLEQGPVALQDVSP